MNSEFNKEKEDALLSFIQKNYGAEIFTPGLERTRQLYRPFIDKVQSKNIKVTIIAGTNGKGQTAHTLAYLLEAAQLGTALWTSPHILSIRERFHSNGQLISYERLEKELFESHSELRANFPDLPISFYEFLFFVFLRWALREGPQLKHLILEVGLGGRLDAVNHFDADCACITSISRDHQGILGRRYDQILQEKIAVSRKGKVLITQFKLQYLTSLTEAYCHKNGIRWINLKNESSHYFGENQEMAKALFVTLEPDRVLAPLESVPPFKGRIEKMTFNTNTLIFIGAHNIEGIRRMSEVFSGANAEKIPDTILVSFSNRPMDELKVMSKALTEFCKERAHLVLTVFYHPKAVEHAMMEELAQINRDKGQIDFVVDWKNEIRKAKNQIILVCGSYYFIGEVQRTLL